MAANKESERFWKEAWTVVFLLDEVPPSRVVLLKRASWKKFAPNYYTGIGGTVEEESALENAIREMAEETGISNLKLNEFARCIISVPGKVVFYYWAIYPGGDLPDCTEGVLEWVETAGLLNKEIIPTTRIIVSEWQRREFALDRSWTLFARPCGDQLFERELERIEEGLVDI